MLPTVVVGIDPGLVHTGLVRMIFDPDHKRIYVEHIALNGADVPGVKAWLAQTITSPHVFIEGYRQRSSFNTDHRMVEAVSQIKAATGGVVLQNTGVKKVVRRPLMELLGVWRFSTPTHHQDLRSAARIALFGMLKNDFLNLLVTGVVTDALDWGAWDVRH